VIELSGGSKPSFKEAAAAHEKDKEHNIAVEDSNLQSLRDTFSIFLTPVLRVVNLYQTELNFYPVTATRVQNVLIFLPEMATFPAHRRGQ
jgi:hypothetical protein